MLDFHKHARNLQLKFEVLAFGCPCPSFLTWDDLQFDSDQLAFSAAQQTTKIIVKIQTSFVFFLSTYKRKMWIVVRYKPENKLRTSFSELYVLFSVVGKS